MAINKCKVCRKKFYVKPSHAAKGWGKYCSKKCQGNNQKVGKYFKCFLCKEPVYRNKKDQDRSKSGKFFCNKSCQTVWRNTTQFAGKNHANWRNGKYSYKQAMLRSNTKQRCSKCNTKDKRVLVVHHKDKNRNNNKLSNLMWLCHNCHYLVHHDIKEAQEFMVPVA